MMLPNYLFWDVDADSIDYSKNARFVIQRVIQKGSIEDWMKIKEFYGIDRIRKEVLLIRDLDSKTLHFFSAYFNINKEDFRCFSIQRSNSKHFNS